MTTMSPVTAAKPRRSAEPLPPLACCSSDEAELLLQAVKNLARPVGRSIVDDDQLDPHRHREHAADDSLSTVVRSLNTGMTTDSSGSAGAGGRAGLFIGNRTVPHQPPGVRREPPVVIFAPNWLGDAVMALPAIADVRRARPDAGD